MKRIIVFISLLIISLTSFSQANSIWNHQRFTGNLHGTRWVSDVTATQTRYILFDDIEAFLVADSLFPWRPQINKLRDSMFAVLNASIALKINISDSANMLLPYVRKGDTANMLSPYARAANYYTKTQSDGRYLQSFTETDPVYTAGITNYYTKAQSDANYYPIAGGVLGTGGYVGFPKLSGSPNAAADVIKEYLDSAGYRAFRYSSNTNGGWIREFIPNITANRQITWPDKNGTLATTTDNISQFNNDAGYLNSIANNSITNAKLATMNAHTYKGNNTAGSSNPVDLTQAQLTAELNTFTTTLKGLVPSPGSSSGNFLKDDGTWAAPPSGFTNPMTTINDIIVGGTSGAPTRLALGGSGTYLKNVSGSIGYGSIQVSDVPTLNQNTTGSAGSISGTNVITNSNLAQMPANTIKINNTGAPATPIDGTVAQTKTLLNYVEGDIPSLTTDLGNKQPITTVATALTAAGTNQSTALALSGNNSIQEVTTTSSGTGVKLPTASNTSSVVVVNRGANTLIVYPATSGIINGQTANLGYLLPSGAVATFFGKDATSWYTENAFTGGDAVTTDASGVITVGGIKGASVPTLTNGLLRNTGGAWSFDASTYLTTAVTSITPGWGLTPQTAITSTGAPLVDSFSVAARARVQKAIDSLNAVLPNSTNALNIAGVNFSIGGPGVQRSWSIGVSLPGQVARMTAASSAINTTETAILSSPTIAANQLTAGSSYRVTFHGTCTSTGANASNFRVRIGNTGGNTDAVVGLITPTAAASGTTIPFAVEFTLTVRTNGSSGTMEGSGQLLNNGVTGVSAATPVVGATQSITVNTTVTNIISVWYVSGATTTTSTFQDCWIECVKI